MTTQKDELVERTKEKIIELFGPESALAQAMEDDDFFKKLADLICWLYGQIILSQPRPEPRYPEPEPEYPTPGTMYKWGETWRTTTIDSPFAHKLWSAMSNYER